MVKFAPPMSDGEDSPWVTLSALMQYYDQFAELAVRDSSAGGLDYRPSNNGKNLIIQSDIDPNFLYYRTFEANMRKEWNRLRHGCDPMVAINRIPMTLRFRETK